VPCPFCTAPSAKRTIAMWVRLVLMWDHV